MQQALIQQYVPDLWVQIFDISD